MTLPRLPLSFAVLATSMLLSGPLQAQEVTGQLGAPSATISLDGKQLPPPAPHLAA